MNIDNILNNQFSNIDLLNIDLLLIFGLYLKNIDKNVELSNRYKSFVENPVIVFLQNLQNSKTNKTYISSLESALFNRNTNSITLHYQNTLNNLKYSTKIKFKENIFTNIYEISVYQDEFELNVKRKYFTMVNFTIDFNKNNLILNLLIKSNDSFQFEYEVKDLKTKIIDINDNSNMKVKKNFEDIYLELKNQQKLTSDFFDLLSLKQDFCDINLIKKLSILFGEDINLFNSTNDFLDISIFNDNFLKIKKT